MADNFCAFGGFGIFEIDERLPACFHTQRIAVVFCKSVYKINLRSQILHPFDVEFIESFQITVAVEAYQGIDYLFLVAIFRYSGCFFEPTNNALNCCTVHTAYFIHLLNHLTVFFGQFAVQSVRNGCGVVRIFHFTVEILHFFLRDSFVVVVGRSGYQIHTGFLVGLFRHHVRVKKNGRELCYQLFYGFTLLQRQFRTVDAFYCISKKTGCESRHYFIFRIVVVNAVSHPDTFQVGFEFLKIIGSLIRSVFIYSFQRATNAQVVFVVLIPENIAPFGSCLRKVINHFFLFQGQIFKAGNTIPEYFNIGKGIHLVIKTVDGWCVGLSFGFISATGK